MKTIKIIIDFDGEINLNGEYKTNGPVEMNWFHDNDLIIETSCGKFIFNTNTAEPINDDIYIIKPKMPEKTLHVVASEKKTIFNKEFTLELAENDSARYLAVTDINNKKFAYKLPENY